MFYLIRRVLAKPRLILDEMCRLYGKFASYFSSYKWPYWRLPLWRSLHNRRFMSQARRKRHFARSARREEEKSCWKEGKWKGVFPLSSFPSPLMLPLADLLSLIREVTNCKTSASSRYLVVHHPSPQPIWIRCRNNKKKVPFLSRGCKIFSTNPKMKPPTPYDSVKII